MLVLVFISVSLRFYQVYSLKMFIYSHRHDTFRFLVSIIITETRCSSQEYSSSKAAKKLSEFVRCPVKVQRCAGRVIQTELIVQVDQRDVVPGDIVIFEPGDLFPGDVRLISSKHLVVRYIAP